jgi:hypothetical protein
MLLALPFGLAIGLSLGALGGGGAVLAVPVLVYVLGQDAHAATTESLAVVATAALAGAVAGTLAGAAVSDAVLLIGFAPVLLGAAAFTWRRADAGGEADLACPPLDRSRTLAAGLTVGLLTGFFGVGGGFLVVPMLALAMRFPLRRAIGTSLVIVGFVSLAGLAAHLARDADLDTGVAAAMAVSCAAGAFAGARLGELLPQRALGHAFALLLSAVGLYILIEGALLGGPAGA